MAEGFLSETLSLPLLTEAKVDVCPGHSDLDGSDGCLGKGCDPTLCSGKSPVQQLSVSGGFWMSQMFFFLMLLLVFFVFVFLSFVFFFLGGGGGQCALISSL